MINRGVCIKIGKTLIFHKISEKKQMKKSSAF